MKRVVLSIFLILLCCGLLPLTTAFADADTTPDVGKGACGTISSGTENSNCTSCFNSGGAWTAVGCIGRDSGKTAAPKLESFLQAFLQIGIGTGGGIAFLLILFSGFQTIMSAGNPEKLHEAQELMTAAISGLLLIIFSIFLLRLIGGNILALPDFSGGKLGL